MRGPHRGRQDTSRPLRARVLDRRLRCVSARRVSGSRATRRALSRARHSARGHHPPKQSLRPRRPSPSTKSHSWRPAATFCPRRCTLPGVQSHREAVERESGRLNPSCRRPLLPVAPPVRSGYHRHEPPAERVTTLDGPLADLETFLGAAAPTVSGWASKSGASQQSAMLRGALPC